MKYRRQSTSLLEIVAWEQTHNPLKSVNQTKILSSRDSGAQRKSQKALDRKRRAGEVITSPRTDEHVDPL